jgi:chemotaxis protein CheC
MEITDVNQSLNEKMVGYLSLIAREGIHNAARGFSGMLGQELKAVNPEIKILPLLDIASVIGGPEDEVVGIYLRATGDMTTQFMMVIPYIRAMELVDMLMDQPAGTSTELGSMERSALAEVGNLTATFFMNALASITGIGLRPTPPAVMVDMVGAIMDVIIATSGGIGDYILMLNSKFILNNREVEADFWVIPDEQTLRLIASRI